MTKPKIIIIIFVATLSTLLFWQIINGYLTRSKAAGQVVNVFFQQKEIDFKDKAGTVDIFFQVDPKYKISGATISLNYPQDLIEYYEPNLRPSPECMSNNFGFKKLVNVKNIPESGSLTITRVALTDEQELPSGLFCFGTVFFRPKQGISIPAVSKIKFDNQGSWEIVGPATAFISQFDPERSEVKVSISGPQIGTINWTTDYVSLKAEGFHILVSEMIYVGNESIKLHSDPGSSTYTTLEAIWEENEVEMRLFIYFNADGKYWWSPEIRTYDGRKQGEWITYEGKYFETPLGQSFTASNFDINGPMTPDSGNQVLNNIHFDKIELQAFLKPSVSVFPSVVIPPNCDNSKGDANCDGKVDMIDFEIWRKEYTSELTTKTADFNNDGKVDMIDFEIWRRGFFTVCGKEISHTPSKAEIAECEQAKGRYVCGGNIVCICECQMSTPMSCNYTVNPPITCPEGYTCKTNGVPGASGNCEKQTGTSSTGASQ